MPRIRILEAVAGADFSWAPGDLVDLPEEQAQAWADGHRAVLADDQEPGSERPSVRQQQPLVVGEDGQELEVIAATLEDIEGPDGAEQGTRWVRWAVTVRLPARDRTPPATAEGPDGTSAEPSKDVPFDPNEHSNREVLAYLDTVGEQEALRVLDAEAAGQNRAGIAKNRDAVLERARARDAATGEHAGAEKTADFSRGGGGEAPPETRAW